MALTKAQSALVRMEIAEVLGISVMRVAAAATILGDLGGTVEHLKPLQEAVERALGFSIEPVIQQINTRVAVGADGLLTAPSLQQIAEYLGPKALIPSSPASYVEIFTVGYIEAMAAKALAPPPDAEELARTLPAKALTLSESYSRTVRERLAEIFEVPLERVIPSARLLTDFDGEDLSIGLALATIEKDLGISLEKIWKGLISSLEDLAGGRPTPATLEQLRIYFPDIDFEGEVTITYEDLVTVGLMEQVVARAIGQRESVAASESGGPRRASQSLIVSAWNWTQQDWLSDLTKWLDPRRLRLLLAGGLRDALAPDGKIDWEIVDALETLERYADTEKSKSALDKMHRKVGTWPIWRHASLSALHTALSEEDHEAALDNLVTAVAVGHKLKAPAALARMERLVAELVSPRKPAEPFEDSWRTPAAIDLAWSMYEERDFSKMPQLADLLERAGCRDREILEHCRDPQGIHFRGCWVVDLVLNGRWTAPPKKKPPKTKTLLSTLSKQSQRDLKDAMAGPEPLGTIPLILAQVDPADIPGHRDSFSKFFPGLSSEQVDQVVLLHNTVEYGKTAEPIALVRRIVDERAEGLLPAVSVSMRSEWVRRFLLPDTEPVDELIRYAFSVRDMQFIQLAAKKAPRREAMLWDEDRWIYLATLAAVERDADLLRKMGELLPQRLPTPDQEAVDLVYRGMAADDPQLVQQGLQQMIDRERAAKDQQGYGVTLFEAHGLYRMAEWYSPELVAGFDVAQGHPWDAEFHRCVEQSADPLAGIDFSTLPPIIRDVLRDLTLPEWLVPSAAYEAIGQPHDLILLSVGPKAKKVASVIYDSTRHPKERIARSIERSPMTIQSRMPRPAAEKCRQELEAAGAQVELRAMTGKRVPSP